VCRTDRAHPDNLALNPPRESLQAPGTWKQDRAVVACRKRRHP
jgi:hypothetical protein